MSQKWKMEFGIGRKLESAIKCSCWATKKFQFYAQNQPKMQNAIWNWKKIGVSNKMLIQEIPILIKMSQKWKMQFGIGRKLESAIKCSSKKFQF